MGTLHSFRVPPHKIRINYKEKKSEFIKKNSKRHNLDCVIKVNITDTQLKSCATWLDPIDIQPPFRGTPAKNAQPECRQEEASDQCKRRDVLQDTRHVILKSIKVRRVKGRLREQF